MEQKDDVITQIAALKKLTTGQLRERYKEMFGEPTNSQNKQYLFKKLAYRIQEKKHGGLTERARARAAELAKDAPVRRRPDLKGTDPNAPTPKPGRMRDSRLPAVGTVIKRTFGEKEHLVKVLETGFEYRGKAFRSLSAIAKSITGSSWNGFTFFGCAKREQA